MTSAESRLTVLENRMDEAERQIYLIWIEIRKLWEEIYDIWGSDGKDNSHNITEIWKKIGELEQEISNLWTKLGEAEDSITEVEKKIKKMKVDITRGSESRNTPGEELPLNPGECVIRIVSWESDSSNEKVKTNIETLIGFYVPSSTREIVCYLNFIPVNYNTGATVHDTLDIQDWRLSVDYADYSYDMEAGYIGSPYSDVPLGYGRLKIHLNNVTRNPYINIKVIQATVDLTNFNADQWPSTDMAYIVNNLAPCLGQGQSMFVHNAAEYMNYVQYS